MASGRFTQAAGRILPGITPCSEFKFLIVTNETFFANANSFCIRPICSAEGI